MYIGCPKCKIRFVVSREQIGKLPRKVKCSKCSHIWYQNPLVQQEDTVQLEPVASVTSNINKSSEIDIHLPAIRFKPINKKYRYNIFQSLSLIGLISLFVILLLTEKHYWNTQITHDIKISEFTAVQTKTGDSTIIKYNILNESKDTKIIPSFRLIGFNKDKEKVFQYTFKKNIKLPPKHLLNITTEMNSIPHGVEQLDLIIGNNIDFILQ